MALKPRRKVKGTPTTRRISISKTTSDKQFQRFVKAKTRGGKRLVELAPQGFIDLGLSVKKVSRRKQYLAKYRDSSGSTIRREHELAHARQVVFHHKAGFPINPHSLLAAFEENAFMITPKPMQEGKPLNIAEIKDIIINSPAYLTSRTVYADLQQLFQNYNAYLSTLVRMTRQPKTRAALIALNKLSRYLPPGEKKAEKHIRVIFGYLEAAIEKQKKPKSPIKVRS